jgi:hypothetical protein
VGNGGEPSRGRRRPLHVCPRDGRARGETDGRGAGRERTPLGRRRRSTARRANPITRRREVVRAHRCDDAEVTRAPQLPPPRARRCAHHGFRRDSRRSPTAHAGRDAATCVCSWQRELPLLLISASSACHGTGTTDRHEARCPRR